jgi:hypothetical protein
VRQIELRDIEQLSLDLRPLLHLADKPLRHKFTFSQLAIRSQQHWQK